MSTCISYNLYNYGIARRIMPDIPAIYGNPKLVNKNDDTYLTVVDHLPSRQEDFCRYGQRRVDFNPYFSHVRTTAYVWNFNLVPDDSWEWVFHFCMNSLDSHQTKPSTEKTKIQVIGRVLRKAEKDVSSHSIYDVTTNVLINTIESLWPNGFDCQRIAYRVITDFYVFVYAELGIFLPVDTVRLERYHCMVADILSGRRGNKHFPRIPDAMLDQLEEGFYNIMHDEDAPVVDRMTAGMMLLETQTGNRSSEIPCYGVDCLHEEMGFDGKTDHYLVYNCIKQARADQGYVPTKTICTDLALHAVTYMLELRKQIPGAEGNPFLYVDGSPSSREGNVCRGDTFKKRYKEICFKYLRHIVEKDWRGIEKCSVRGRKYSIPVIHSYRVTFATQLYEKGVPLDYVDCLLAHSPMSNVTDDYIQIRVNKDRTIDRIFNINPINY